GDADGDATDANTLTVNVTAAIDPLLSTVTVDPPIVVADGVSLSTITVTLIDTLGNPVTGKTITLASSRGATDILTQPAGPTDANGQAFGTIQSTTIGEATISAMDTTDGITLLDRPRVIFTQGRVLDLIKTANKKEVVVGDVVTYRVELKNTTTDPVLQVKLEDKIPQNFKYIGESTLLNGAKFSDPSGNRKRVFDIGTIPAWVDTNGNGETDPDEPGYFLLSYQLVVGSGAEPGEYSNTAVAKDVCDLCPISNVDEATVTVTLDPLFDLGTIIGKVFQDENHNGWQDRNEPGIAGTMVALDDGTYALTDEHGRYHFPAVRPGQRLVKINLHSVAIEARATTSETVVLTVTPGLLAKANFGIVYIHSEETIGRPREFGLLMKGE
ncbi:MAG TPA: invasin domain 3-containing protein, partial [Nitrospiria bacterium]|nr:invasin domain 3-containing protein [Nitrospiria bacterium]